MDILFPDDSFLLKSEDFSEDTDAKFIHISNGVVLPSGEEDKNHTPAPGAAERLIDDEVIMRIHEFTTKATKIPNIDEVEVAYNKRMSVVKRHVNVVRDLMQRRVLFEWFPTKAGNIIRGTGAELGTKVPGATGNRSIAAIEQINEVAGMMDDAEVSAKGRVMMIPSHWYRKLINDHWKDLVKLQTVGTAVLGEGTIVNLFGFEVIVRAAKKMPFYNNASTPVPQLEGTTLTTANSAALFWHPDFVCRAVAEVEFFENLKDALHHGDIYSTLLRGGGCKNYKNETGVYAIVESAV